MAIETTRWDAAEHLDTPQAIAAYVDAALEEGDPKLVAAALGDAAGAGNGGARTANRAVAREPLSSALI
jgi:probable addiction module antidote protein